MLRLDSAVSGGLATAVLAVVAGRLPGRSAAAGLLRRIAKWVGTHGPDAPAA